MITIPAKGSTKVDKQIRPPFVKLESAGDGVGVTVQRAASSHATVELDTIGVVDLIHELWKLVNPGDALNGLGRRAHDLRNEMDDLRDKANDLVGRTGMLEHELAELCETHSNIKAKAQA